jgi:LacI family transcriptional regulator
MAVTQKDIAQRVGVSQQAVAHALSGKGRLSESTRERILDEAKRMGYRPNPLARALLTGKTNLISLWLPSEMTPFYAQVAHDIERLVSAEPYNLVITNVERYRESSSDNFAPAAWPVDGILAFEVPRLQKGALGLESGPPIVCLGVNWLNTSRDFDAVAIDLRPGADEAMRHLLPHRRRVAMMTIPELLHVKDARCIAYEEAMNATGLKPEYIFLRDISQLRATARQAVKAHIAQHGHPNAIFCASDEEAIGTHRGLCDLQLKIPGDVALLGCDGIEDTEYLTPAISTIKQPTQEMCRLGWEMLQKRIAHPETTRQFAELQAHLEIRESSR